MDLLPSSRFTSWLLILIVVAVINPARAQAVAARSDVVVYGGTGAGVIAAVEAARMGKHVILIEPTRHLGGISSSGLGWTDVGNPNTIGGLAREFYGKIYDYYQNPAAWTFGSRENFLHAPGQRVRAIDSVHHLMWVFEPKAAEAVFDQIVQQPGITVVLGQRLDLTGGVTRQGTRILSIRMESGEVYSADVFIDASYEGDLMAKAGVTCVVGREANCTFGETINGIQTDLSTKNQLLPVLDPYVIKGDRSSGLLPGVNADPAGADGQADHRIQAYCYRMCLTDVPENRVMVTCPSSYNPKDYELLFRAIEAGQHDHFFKLDRMPNGKTDSNNDSGISTDFVGMNYAYPEGDYATREKIAAAHEAWQQGLLWTLQNHPRVPAKIRAAYAQWGLPKDEFMDNGHWPPQLYIREARRMRGMFVETESTLLDDSLVADPIAMGSYAMDSHNVQRYASPGGYVQNEGDVQMPVPRPYKISYGAIVSQVEDCTNLLVPVCLSATHVAYGSIRMEPVFMMLGQSAGAAAALAIDHKSPVQRVAYSELRDRLLKDKQVLFIEK
jgi:hypothetical protein